MGLEAAGMTTVFQCEIDKHARSVLDYHWPDVPKWDDVSTLTGAHILEVTGGVDVVAWGSPCQDLSLAGKRAGLSGERSGLFHEGIRIIKELRELSNGKYPTWSIWENVVGALSSNRGADFGEVLYEMDEAGACFSEWTVLDAQYFGVPQRRRRVFVTSCFDSATSERCGSPLFPVCESVSGDSSEGGKKKQGATRSTQDRIGTSGQWAAGSNTDGVLTTSVTSKWYKGTGGPSGSEHYNLVVEPITFVKSRRAQSVNDHETWVESDVTPTLNVFDIGDIRATTAIIEATPIQDGREIEKHQNGLGIGKEGDPMYTLDQTGGQAVAYSIREDATANNFSATEIETARALQALQPSVQSHHAQTFITQPILLDGRRVDDVRVYTEPVQTLQERMGTGGNNVPVVAQETILSFDTQFGSNANVFSDQSPTLKSSQQPPSVAQETILLRNREGKPGGGKGPLISEDISLTLGTSNDQTLFQTGQEEVQAISYDGYNQVVEEEIHRPWRIGKDSSDFIADFREPTLIVRRLTPLECERLMGWPDNHTAQSTNGFISDTQRYKMCGNGVASPVATWIAKHILANGS
jgi:DNA (cytosine-5)-methyltransferase 1